jgi:4-amino-4-deoxy-L-arabinose transferase-like glycosyltransferase
VFSYMQGIIHPYYMIALAPAFGAVIGGAMSILWRRRAEWLPRTTLAGGALLTAGWSFALLNETPAWHPWLRWVVLITGVLAAGLILLLPELKLHRTAGRRAGVAAAAILAFSALAGPTAYSLSTISSAHTGAIPTAGPGVMSGMGGGRGGFVGGVRGFLGGGGISGVSSELVTLLQNGAKGYTWAAAAVTANGAAPLQIASGEPVMAIGGFNGTDSAPSLAEFEQLVAQGKIHYFVGSSGGGMMGGRDGTSSEIATWVSDNFTAQTVGNTTVYDLSTGTGA